MWVVYVLSEPGGSCTEACVNGCNEDSFVALQSADSSIISNLDPTITCSSIHAWNYGQGPSICTETSCCQGSCINACAFPAQLSTCDAKQETHSRICPCVSALAPDGKNWNFELL